MHHHSILCWLDGFYIYRAECGEADTTEVCHGCLFVTYLFIWYSLICPFSLSCRVYLIFWVLDSENIVIQDVVLIILVFILLWFHSRFFKYCMLSTCSVFTLCLMTENFPTFWVIYIYTHTRIHIHQKPTNQRGIPW